MDIKVNSKTVIVFDLDDTLYNEITYLQSAYREIARKLDDKNWRLLYTQMFSLYRCKENVFEFLAKNHKIDIAELIKLYRHHQPTIKLFPGVLTKFEDIKSLGGNLGLITDGRSKTQRAKLKALKIEEYFDCVIISEELGSEKPSANNYLAIEEKFPNHKYCYIADNFKKDFVAPNKLGWLSIGVQDNGLNIHFEAYKFTSKKHHPQHIITSIEELNIT